MKNSILAVIFAVVVLTGFSVSQTKASTVTNDQSSTQVSNDQYIYIRICENGVWFVYTYTTDGIFVAKSEQS